MPLACSCDFSLPRSASCPQADKQERVTTQSAHIATHTAETNFRTMFLRSIRVQRLASGHFTCGNVIKRLAQILRLRCGRVSLNIVTMYIPAAARESFRGPVRKLKWRQSRHRASCSTRSVACTRPVRDSTAGRSCLSSSIGPTMRSLS